MGKNFCVLKTCDRVHCSGLEQGTSRGGGNSLGVSGIHGHILPPSTGYHLWFVLNRWWSISLLSTPGGPNLRFRQTLLWAHTAFSLVAGAGTARRAWGGWVLAAWSAELLWGTSLQEGQARVPPPRLSVTVSLPLPAQVGGLPSHPGVHSSWVLGCLEEPRGGQGAASRSKAGAELGRG